MRTTRLGWRAFWAPVLGYEMQPPPEGHASWRAWYLAAGVPEDELTDVGDDYCDRIHDPTGGGPRIWFQLVPETKSGKNRLHLDVYPGGWERERAPVEERRRLVDARVAELVAAGATIRSTPAGSGDHYAVGMSDPEGNEFCVA